MHAHFHPRFSSLHLGCDWQLGGGWLSVTAAVTSDLGDVAAAAAVAAGWCFQMWGRCRFSQLYRDRGMDSVQEQPALVLYSLVSCGHEEIHSYQSWKWREATVTALLATACSHKQAWVCCVFRFIKLGFRGQKLKIHNVSPVVLLVI